MPLLVCVVSFFGSECLCFGYCSFATFDMFSCTLFVFRCMLWGLCVPFASGEVDVQADASDEDGPAPHWSSTNSLLSRLGEGMSRTRRERKTFYKKGRQVIKRTDKGTHMTKKKRPACKQWKPFTPSNYYYYY